MNQLEALQWSLVSGRLGPLDEEKLDLVEPPDPVAKFAASMELEKAGAGDWAWNTELAAAPNADLHKRASDNAERDLSKRAAPHKVNYERTMVGGEAWILGWNDRGENVYAATAADHQQMYKDV